MKQSAPPRVAANQSDDYFEPVSYFFAATGIGDYDDPEKSTPLERDFELLAVYILAPLAVFFGWWPARAKMLLLAIAAIIQLLIVWNGGASGAELGFSGGDFQRCAIDGLAIWLAVQTLGVIARRIHQRPIFPFVQSHPRLFLQLAVAYWLSVVGQEFMYRSYFFWRFSGVGSLQWLIIVNVLVFGWIHIVFRSWFAIGLTLVGGIFFTELYMATHSFWGICIVHWFFGLSLFAMGYGRHFYTGSHEIARRLNGCPDLAV